MRSGWRLPLLLAAVVLFPAIAQAQTIAGVVRDASGAVLPGVTVEASSPALIEKVRSAVTDGSGQFRLDSLVAGAYSVTYTLARLLDGQAGRRAGADRRDGDPQRRPARGRHPGNDHRLGRDAGRGRAEQHARPDGAERRSAGGAAGVPRLRQPADGVSWHSGQRHAERWHQPGDDLLHVARRPQQRGHRADRRHERRLGVQRRRRGRLRLRHRQRAGSAAHRGGRARRGRPRRAAVQHRAQDRRQHLRRHLLLQPGRHPGRRATTWTTSCGRSASPAPPRSSGTGIPASRLAGPSSGTGCGSTVRRARSASTPTSPAASGT